MSRIITATLFAILALPVLATDIRLVDTRHAPLLIGGAERGVELCRTAIQRQFDRSDRLRLKRRLYMNRSMEADVSAFYVNATVNVGDTRKEVAFSCTTNFSGRKLVDLNQIDGRYVRTGSTQLGIASR